MYLTPAQSKRFYDLFNRFTTYVNAKYEINDKLFDKRSHRIDEELQKVTSYIWEHHEIIDEFVDTNPLNFKLQDLETIRSWRYAIKGRFLLMEHLPQYSVFIANEHIFKVVGITQDIVEVVPQVPSLIETTLLPFEDKIVYSVSIVNYQIKYGSGILEIFEEDYERARKKDAYVGTTVEFIKASKEYYESKHNRELDRVIDEHQHEQRKLKGELPAGMHKGALSGKTDEDRWNIIRADLEKNYRSTIQKITKEELIAVAWRRKPHTDLRSTLKCMPRESLENLLLYKGLPFGDILKKDNLITLLMSTPEDFTKTFALMLEICPSTQFEMLCRLMEEKGILWIREDEATVDHMECVPIPPYLNLYYNQHKFAYVMPSELLDATATIDMDEIVSKREDLQTIRDYAAIMTELCGIVSVDDFLSAYDKNHPDPLDEESAFNILELLSVTSAIGWTLWENDEDLEDDELYIISALLLNSDQEDEEEDEDDEEKKEENLFHFRQYLLARHQQIPLKQYDIEEIRQTGLFDYVTSVPEVRALRDYLDAHVPDDQDDFYFADNIVDALYNFLDWTLNPSDIIDVLCDHGLFFDDDDIDETNDMLKVLYTAMNAMPHWTNNGWTPDELANSKTASRGGTKGKLIDFETGQQIGRNDLCPCGSGKKYKKCHGRSDR
jgi:hypothetical protein